MEQLVEFIVKSIVTNTDAVEISKEVVNTEEGNSEVTIYVKVAETDIGKVIGKNGKIAQAIRTIIKTASNGENKKYFVKIIDK